MKRRGTSKETEKRNEKRRGNGGKGRKGEKEIPSGTGIKPKRKGMKMREGKSG